MTAVESVERASKWFIISDEHDGHYIDFFVVGKKLCWSIFSGLISMLTRKCTELLYQDLMTEIKP